MNSFEHLHTVGQIAGLLRPILDQRAYLDPGSGSFLLQLLIATLLGGLFLLRTYWRKVTAFFSRLFSRGKTTPNDDE
jgi:hypothetical protein